MQTSAKPAESAEDKDKGHGNDDKKDKKNDPFSFSEVSSSSSSSSSSSISFSSSTTLLGSGSSSTRITSYSHEKTDVDSQKDSEGYKETDKNIKEISKTFVDSEVISKEKENYDKIINSFDPKILDEVDELKEWEEVANKLEALYDRLKQYHQEQLSFESMVYHYEDYMAFYSDTKFENIENVESEIEKVFTVSFPPRKCENDLDTEHENECRKIIDGYKVTMTETMKKSYKETYEEIIKENKRRLDAAANLSISYQTWTDEERKRRAVWRYEQKSSHNEYYSMMKLRGCPHWNLQDISEI